MLSIPLSITLVSAATENINPLIYRPDEKIFGLSYGEWGANWWKWALSIPKPDNPLFDNTGVKCSINQNGSVWLLAGTYRGSVERQCDILSGKAILFPVINVECSVLEGDGKTESELKTCTNGLIKQLRFMEASVDGAKIENLEKYRAQSNLFEFKLPSDNTLGRPAGSSGSVSDGYWIMLKPLSPGKHEIHFRAVMGQPGSTSNINFGTEVKYHLNVK